MVERDLHLRRQEVADPEQAERRSIHEICDELSKRDHNNAKQHLRNTAHRSVSARDDDDELSAVDVAVSHEGEDPAGAWATAGMVREALASLDPKDCLVVVGIHMHGYTQAQIARFLGVSQPAVAKRLKKAKHDCASFCPRSVIKPLCPKPFLCKATPASSGSGSRIGREVR